MREEREYQQKMLNSKKKIVFCNWKRGSGKSYSIFQYMITNGGSYTVISDSTSMAMSMSKLYGSLIQEWLNANSDINEFIEHSMIARNKIELSLNRKGFLAKGYSKLKIDFVSDISDISYLTDYVVCEEYNPSSNELRHILNIRGLTKVFIINTLGDIDYIDDKETDIDNFYEKQIEELKVEYSNIPKRENTTKTRESILNMIERMEGMCRRNVVI